MKIYQIEQLIVERNHTWKKLQKYVESEAINFQAHVIEHDLFKMLLEIGKGLLQEAFIRFENDWSKNSMLSKSGERFSRHKISSRQYKSIFVVIEITRTCYWKPNNSCFFPLDAHFNLPERRYSNLLVKWVQDGVAEGPYEEGLQRIYNIFGIKLCKRSQEVLSQEVAVDVEQFYKEHQIKEESEGSIIIGTTDCKGVVMVPKERSEQTQSKAQHTVKARDSRGRKGLKRDAVVTSDYTINPEVRTPEDVIELLMRSQTKEQLKEKKET